MTALPTRIVLTYPGQGGYSPGLLARLASHGGAAAVIDRVRAAWQAETGEDLSEAWSSRDCGLDELARTSFGATQVTIFAAGLAAHAAVRESIRGGVTHLGHSFGELTALTAAEAWSVEDGVRAVAARCRALVGCNPGGMAAVAADGPRVQGLAAAVGDPAFTVAGHTGPGQVVVAGALGSLERFERAASALGMSSTRLASPYAFHSQELAQARAGFAEALRGLSTRPPVEVVHSAIAGRDLTGHDDLPALLADALVDPFDLGTATRTLHARGATVFIECGGRTALTSAVKRALRGQPSARPWVAVPVDDGSELPARAAVRAVEQWQGAPDEIAPLPVGVVEELRQALQADLAEMAARLLGELTALPRVDGGNGRAPVDAHPVRTGGQASVGRAPLADPAPEALAPAPPTATKPSSSATRSADTSAVPVDTVLDLSGASGTGPVPEDRAGVLADLVAMYAEALEYPAEVLEEGIELEGDLGVDSVKQTELLGRTAERYGLPTAPADLSIADLRTLGAIADLVVRTRPVPVG